MTEEFLYISITYLAGMYSLPNNWEFFFKAVILFAFGSALHRFGVLNIKKVVLFIMNIEDLFLWSQLLIVYIWTCSSHILAMLEIASVTWESSVSFESKTTKSCNSFVNALLYFSKRQQSWLHAFENRFWLPCICSWWLAISLVSSRLKRREDSD